MQASAVNVSFTAGRERPDRDLDELVDGERGSWVERPVRAGGVRAAEGPRHAGAGAGGPDLGQRLALDEEVTGAVQQADHRVAAAWRSSISVRCSRTAGSRCSARARSRCSSSRRASSLRSEGPALARGSAPGERCLRPRSRAPRSRGDARDHLRQLDRLGDVVDEHDEHRDVDEHQRHRHRDRDVRHEFPVAAGADRDEREDRVDERRDEAAERHLGDRGRG